MSGERDLQRLLSGMEPVLKKGEFVFCTLEDAGSILKEGIPIMAFKEEEGTTLILAKDDADKLSFQYDIVWSQITLSVHSDLEAVGFIAEVSKCLAQEGISVNVVSAFYHDHLFVPASMAQTAVKVLLELSEKSEKN